MIWSIKFVGEQIVIAYDSIYFILCEYGPNRVSQHHLIYLFYIFGPATTVVSLLFIAAPSHFRTTPCSLRQRGGKLDLCMLDYRWCRRTFATFSKFFVAINKIIASSWLLLMKSWVVWVVPQAKAWMYQAAVFPR